VGERAKKKVKVVSRRLNIRRAILVVAVAGWAQVVTALALALMFFTGNQVPTAVLLVTLFLFLLAGNYVVMRRALGILNAERAMAEVEATLESATELNRKLRVQRHDFMNHLQVVHGLMELEDYTEARKYIGRVYKDIQSVSRLVRTDNAAVNALLSAKAEEAAGRNVLMEFNIRSRAMDLSIEPWELCAVLGNLLDNAFDALEGGEDGDIVRLHIWEELDSFNFSVENNGLQIPTGIISKIFEPGFSTKGEHGQGLGLHIVRETLENRGGGIEVKQDGKWTCFSGHLPLIRGAGRLNQWNS
jgi:two-component system, LytTR family, sensor histidine kinase AgrC